MNKPSSTSKGGALSRSDSAGLPPSDSARNLNRAPQSNLAIVARGKEIPRPQVVGVPKQKRRPVSSSTCLNQHIKRSIYRVVFESDLEVETLLQVAWMFGITGPHPERKVLDILREGVREAKRQSNPPPTGGAPAVIPMRRAA
jgi:hypothetical protein